MNGLNYRRADESDIEFISATYNANIPFLHGAIRGPEEWKELLSREGSVYYIVFAERPAAWFRIDYEDGGFWLGMLQVDPLFKRKGIGRFVLSIAEKFARKKGFDKIGIHTTADNLAAQALYASAGYVLTETGPCTTADGVERTGLTFEKALV